jgi:hypothetical protein
MAAATPSLDLWYFSTAAGVCGLKEGFFVQVILAAGVQQLVHNLFGGLKLGFALLDQLLAFLKGLHGFLERNLAFELSHELFECGE